MRILLHCQRDDVQTAVSAAITGLGHEIRPIHALHAIAAERGDVLLIELPRQPGGWQAGVNAGRGAGVPVLFVDPSGDAARVAEALRGGAHDVLPHPLAPRALHWSLRMLAPAQSAAAGPALRLARRPPERLELDPTGLDIDAWHRAIVIAAIERHGGSPVRTAEFLGLTRKVLYTLRKRYGLLEPGEPEET